MNIYSYDAISRTRREWREYIIKEVAGYFGPIWGEKAREWLKQEEELFKRVPMARPETTQGTPVKPREEGAADGE